MASRVLEYWKGLEELRPLIHMAQFYDVLDPECYYLGHNYDVDGDQVEIGDLDSSTLQLVMTFDEPGVDGVSRELYVHEFGGILAEVW